VLAQNPDRVDDVVQRLEAVQAFAALPESASLAAANKRITNILKKTEAPAGGVQDKLLQEEAERKLAASVARVRPEVDAAFARGDFTGTLKTLAQLRDDVDAFFNDVMVMADDLALRNNRLALLSQLHTMMNRVADISKLAA
jgi:glycyl-tRNA synthetase beta chain